MLGAAVECPVCLHPVVPYVPTGTTFPLTGYAITFRDFCQLFTDPGYRPHVIPPLREWFGYEAPLTPAGFSIVARDGSSVSPFAVHQDIQSDPQRQYALYQTAMSLWR
jgi:hypothetical protein